MRYIRTNKDITFKEGYYFIKCNGVWEIVKIIPDKKLILRCGVFKKVLFTEIEDIYNDTPIPLPTSSNSSNTLSLYELFIKRPIIKLFRKTV